MTSVEREPGRVSLGERLADHVGSRADRLQKRYLSDRPDAVAELAILRRGVAQQPGSDPRLLGLTVAGLYPNPSGLQDEILPAERAAYASLTLFAVHQQSHRDRKMHSEDYPFGRSARLLGRHSGSRDAVRARFTALATASTWDETMHHARGLIQQLRAYGIPLGYGQFARDLLDLQRPTSADRVRLVWGRHFYREHSPDDDEVSAPSTADDPTDRDI